MIQSVLKAYGLGGDAVVTPFGSGLINYTWKVTVADSAYILQRINDVVFKEPGAIAHNISLIANYLKQQHPQYFFVAPRHTVDGEEMIFLKGEGYFRVFPFVARSHSKDVVANAAQAYEAAAQFGRFTGRLSGLDVSRLKTTIPHFHNLGLRYQQFLQSLQSGDKERFHQSKHLIAQLMSHAHIVDAYHRLKQNPHFKIRVTHHDTKISNVLFDDNDKGLCVIDLDTVMPGYFISDVGDMIRTYISPVSEEETDFNKIEVRDDFYNAVVQGYCSGMKDALTAEEGAHVFYAGTFMIYMQALRFLTDYLNNDVYYGARYEGHNFIRAGNQCVLLTRLIEKKKQWV